MTIESAWSDGPVDIQARLLRLFKTMPLSLISLGEYFRVWEHRNKYLERNDFEPSLFLLWFSLSPDLVGFFWFSEVIQKDQRQDLSKATDLTSIIGQE